MTSGIDYVKQYGKANAAYCRGDLDEAVSLIDQLAQEYPDDPHTLLLRGHIFLSMQQYQIAQQEYEKVLKITQQPDLLDYAERGLEQIQLVESDFDEMDFTIDETEGFTVSQANLNTDESFEQPDFSHWSQHPDMPDLEEMDWGNQPTVHWNPDDDDMGEPTIGKEFSRHQFANPFAEDAETSFNPDLSQFEDLAETFGLPSEPSHHPELERYVNSLDQPGADDDQTNFYWHNNADEDEQRHLSFIEEDNNGFNSNGYRSNFDQFSDTGESTLVVSSDLPSNALKSNATKFLGKNPSNGKFSENLAADHSDSWNEEAFRKEPQQRKPLSSHTQQPANSDGFLNDLEVFNDDDLDGLSQFDITDVAQSLPDSGLFERHTDGLDSGLETGSGISAAAMEASSISKINWTDVGENSSANLTGASTRFIKPTVEIEQGKFSALKNLPLKRKQWITAGIAGLTSVATIFLISSAIWMFSPKQPSKKADSPANKTESVSSNPKKSDPKTDKKTTPKKNSSSSTALQAQQTAAISPFSPSMLLMMLLTGGATFGATLFFARLSTNQIKQTVDDLQTQFDAIYAGDFNVKATVYSEDELGQLSARFNQMAQAILTTTSEAQRRAAETEQQKEDLQRQVIRLLDDVEGAARGDLTVEAEVTADVLGAVADAFNLTIQNLREIVRQVKKAAEQVNKGSTDSELFARNQSSDALRMAEELAVTLNSVQMMTDSIQRVAENAREAEEVARTSSVTALKGGESVERTVAGILQIRETVSETARKVKRLAEASQEINKIVAVVSQIASRTNLLALNASIQAARAGEAGRGFAIVADEVRQLADRSAKSLKEIEQIVLQIQSETGSVMTAMEEGIQQVIDVTERSEQAKRSLEDIIQVSNRIDSLVRSITGDTVKQRENSREVAQVMQSVELTAQETSQESQRVAGSLQTLVKISRDLLESVERFKVDKNDYK
ncbi:methyl-accepting chemotaxis protein [Gloeothece verrucosa]|uniref:Methyl-accepting chemotaxis sensory transducer n=1 Tax=Gloeothece verrucosa (strain PCC 7822) TaxID=497965 RepID=E0UEC6_GLOV7|nr:methyl-accepting chemotaxis protein [Gloeothece verrucosa]ADN15372.1 methyl-accepting chemotaxis sensory transducer [Gloeothece verrucosa PCC 7822]